MKITKELLKIFVDWTKLKVRIHVSSSEVYPKVREIWWASLGQNIGIEINGKNDKFDRPVVIIKIFNNLGVLVAPISSTIKKGEYFIEFKNYEDKMNIINMSQIRSISSKRLLRNVGELSQEDFEKVRQVYLSLI